MTEKNGAGGWHRCYPPTDPRCAEVTSLRTMKLLVAMLNGRDEAAMAAGMAAVVKDFVGCPHCLSQALFQAIGFSTGLIRQHQPDMVIALELRIAAAEATPG